MPKIGRFYFTFKFSNSDMARLVTLDHWLTDHLLELLLLPCSKKDVKKLVPMRTLNWLVTNYAKKNKIILDTGKEVFSEYENIKKKWQCPMFDAFRRGKRRLYFTWEGEELFTTIGQLNMLNWSWETGVYSYAIENSKVIEEDRTQTMEVGNKRKEEAKTSGVKLGRTSLSKGSTVRCSIVNQEIVVQFS